MLVLIQGWHSSKSYVLAAPNLPSWRAQLGASWQGPGVLSHQIGHGFGFSVEYCWPTAPADLQAHILWGFRKLTP